VSVAEIPPLAARSSLELEAAATPDGEMTGSEAADPKTANLDPPCTVAPTAAPFVVEAPSLAPARAAETTTAAVMLIPSESAPESASETTGLSEAITVMATTKAEVTTPAVAPEATGVTSEAPPATNQVAKLMALRAEQLFLQSAFTQVALPQPLKRAQRRGHRFNEREMITGVA